MKGLKLFILLLLIPVFSNSQWSTSSGSNKFDGNYKTAYVIGKGGEWPYNKPNFVVNRFDFNEPGIYLTGVGYTGCKNNILLFSFDNDKEIFYCYNNSTNSDKDAIFIDDFENTTITQFIGLLKSKNKMQVRFSNSCGIKDYEFSLSGSTNSINYALGDYLKKEVVYEEIEEGFEDQYKTFLNDFKCGNKMTTQRHAFVLRSVKNVSSVEFASKFMSLQVGDNLKYFNIYVDSMVFVRVHRGSNLLLEDFITLEECLRISEDPRFKVMFSFLETIFRKNEDCS